MRWLFALLLVAQFAVAGSPQVVLVLSGGAARGAAHIGVIRALVEEGVPIDAIVGTSMGALVGGLYAAGLAVDELGAVFASVAPSTAVELLLPPRGGLLDSTPLELLLAALLEERQLNDTPLAFYPVAAELRSGEARLLSDGSLATAIRAATAIPGLFGPVALAGEIYYDAGITDYVPVALARTLQPRVVIAVTVGREAPYDPASLLANLQRILGTVTGRFTEPQLREADVIIAPKLAEASYMAYDRAEAFADAGYRAARQAMPEILAALEQAGIGRAPPGDPHRGLAINDGWRDRLALARRELVTRARPWHFMLDLGLGPADYLDGITPAGALPRSVARLGMTVGGGFLDTWQVGVSYGRSLLPGDTLELRLRWRPRFELAGEARLHKDLHDRWRVEAGVEVAPQEGVWLRAAVAVPEPTLYLTGRSEGLGYRLELGAAQPLDFSFTRLHLDLRGALAHGDVTVRGRAFVGFAGTAAPLAERISLGSRTVLRGYLPDQWVSPLAVVTNLELVYTPLAGVPALEVVTLSPALWLFGDLGYAPEVGLAPSLGVGVGLSGAFFGFLPFDLGVDLGFGLNTGDVRLTLRPAFFYPAPWRP